MGHYGVVVRNGEERVHNNVPHKLSVALSREDVVYALPIACPVEGMRDAVLGGTGERVHQGSCEMFTALSSAAQNARFLLSSRVHSVGPYATTNETALARPCNFKVTFRSRSLINSGGRTTAHVMVSLMASPTPPWTFFPLPLSPHAHCNTPRSQPV